MSTIIFPNPRHHHFAEWVLFGDYYYSARDIIGFGGELSVTNLRSAYRNGIFPWHIDGLPLPWYCPEKRAILEFDKLKVSRSLRKDRRRSEYRLSIDEAFPQVIANCARVARPEGPGTWITDEFEAAYIALHHEGDAHSVEVWENDELVGGLYGVDAGGVFCGESMFHLRPNTSKFALLHLVEHLSARGATWLDVQVMTPHFKAFGAVEIDRADFLERLETTQTAGPNIF
jgi:leucyl/phenylalanyl-tRNA--protein transferase